MKKEIEVNVELRKKLIASIEKKIYSIPEIEFSYNENRGYLTAPISIITVDSYISSYDVVTLIHQNDYSIRYYGGSEESLSNKSTKELAMIDSSLYEYEEAKTKRTENIEKSLDVIPVGTLLKTPNADYYIVSTLPYYKDGLMYVGTVSIDYQGEIKNNEHSFCLKDIVKCTQMHKEGNDEFYKPYVISIDEYVESRHNGLKMTIESRQSAIKGYKEKIASAEEDIQNYQNLHDNIRSKFNENYNKFLKDYGS